MIHIDEHKTDKLETRGEGLKPQTKKTAIGMYGHRIVVVCPLPYFNHFFRETLPDYFKSTSVDIVDRLTREEFSDPSYAHERGCKHPKSPILILDFCKTSTPKEFQEVDKIVLFGERQATIRKVYGGYGVIEGVVKNTEILGDPEGWKKVVQQFDNPPDMSAEDFARMWAQAERKATRIVERDFIVDFDQYRKLGFRADNYFPVQNTIRQGIFTGEQDDVMNCPVEPYEELIKHDLVKLMPIGRRSSRKRPENLKFFSDGQKLSGNIKDYLDFDSDLLSSPDE